MEEIEIEEGEACINQDNDEKIDPDSAFSYIDKRIQDVLGHYQKDFMGGVSAENLGARWGGYGSFLCEASSSPLSLHSRSQTQSNIKTKSSNYTMVEGLRQQAISQANPPLPAKPELGTTGCCVQSLAVPTSLPHGLVRGNEEKHLEALSLSPTKVSLEVGSMKFITGDMSELYSCLGLVISPSSSPGDGPPLEFVQISTGMDEMSGKSPSFIVKAMTSFPVPGDHLLSPLLDNVLSLRIKEINTASMALKKNEKDNAYLGHDKASLKKDLNSISVKKRVGLTEARKINQRDGKGQLAGLEKKIHANIMNSLDASLKSKEYVGQSKKEETFNYPPNVNEVNMVSKDEDASNVSVEDNVSRTKLNKQPNRQEDTAVEQLAPLTSQRPLVAEIGKSNGSMEVLHKNKVVPVTKKHNCGDEPGRQVKSTVKDCLLDLLSYQEDGIQDQKKMNMKVKEVRKENMANANRGKRSLGNEKHGDGTHDSFHRSKGQSSRVKSGSDLTHSKDCSTSNGKKKLMKKGKHYCQPNTVLPKVSFRVGSSSLLQGQNTDQGTDSSGGGKMDVSAPRKHLKKLDKGYIDSGGKSISKKKKKVTSMKGSALGVSEREKSLLSSKSNNKSRDNELLGASSVKSCQGEDPNDNTLLMETGHTSVGHAEVLPPAPVLIRENWIECVECLTWRLLPLHLTPVDLPDNWRCFMLDWLPGMNECRFSEDQTTEAVRAKYQPIPPDTETKYRQMGPYIGEASKITSFDTTNVGMFDQALGGNDIHTVGIKRQYPEVFGDSKKDQHKAVEIESKRKVIQPTSKQLNSLMRIGNTGTIMRERKRFSLKDADAVHKNPKRHHKDIVGGLDSKNLSTTDFRKTDAGCLSLLSPPSKDLAVSSSFSVSKNPKGNAQWPINTGAEDTNVLMKKRHMKVLDNDELRHVKRSKTFEGFESQEKESGRNQESDINDVGHQDCAHHGSSSRKVSRRDGKSMMGKCKRNISSRVADVHKLSTKPDIEPRLPETASTSSSSKVSSKMKYKTNEVRCSPVGSISSSTMKVSKSNHNRTRYIPHACHDKLEESLLIKKKAPELDDESCHGMDGKAKNVKDPGFLKSKQVYRVYGTDKILNGKPVCDGTWRNEMNLEAHKNVCNETHHFHKNQQTSSHENLTPKDQAVSALDGSNLHKNNDENAGCKEEMSKLDYQSGRAKEHPSSSSQFVDCEAGDRSNILLLQDSDVSFPKLVNVDLGPSGSGKKDGVDWAAVTALKEAKRLKHSANRMKISGSGLSTVVFFEAALKFLHGASLMETGDNEGIRCGDMKPMEVYSTTANLCEYCAHEFEKSNDLASAALAYKCMETAYMRVLYCCTAVTGRDVQVLRTAERAIPPAASPSSSASDVDNVNNAPASDAANSSANRGNIVIPAEDQPPYLRTLKIIDYVHFAMDAARKSIGTYEAACLALEVAGKAESVVSLRRAVGFSFNNIDELLRLVRLAMEAVGGG